MRRKRWPAARPLVQPYSRSSSIAAPAPAGAATGSGFPVVALDPLDLFPGTQYNADALVQGGRLDVKNALAAVGGGAPGLFHDKAHGIGLIHQPQFSGLARGPLVARVHEDAAARQDAMHIRHHRGDPAHVVVLAQRTGLARQAVAY